ncbi:MAG TPA: hypothetical protein VNN18_10135 [Candidatus Xenobia bacterium]|nr:hypothetical protein [Candidatus Xenobia bacterium]
MHTEPSQKHELRDVPVRIMAYIVVGLTLLTLGGAGVSWWYLRVVEEEAAVERPVPPLAATLPKEPPEPRLQVTPAVDLATARAREDALLNSYGWIDAKSGLVRIPIDRAIEVLAERGLPARTGSKDENKASNKR